MLKKYLIITSFFISLFLTLKCYASEAGKNFSHAVNINKSFCLNIAFNNYKDINKNWSEIKKTKNVHIYKKKEKKLRINILYRSNKIQRLIFKIGRAHV